MTTTNIQQWLSCFFNSTLWPGIAGFATCIAAAGALVAGFLAWRSLCETRKAERIKHTLQLIDSTASQGFAEILNTILSAAAPTSVRIMVQARVEKGVVTESDIAAGKNLVGFISYAADLIAARIADERLFVQRSALQVALAAYMYEPVMAGFLRQALGRRDAVLLMKKCAKYAQAIATETNIYPELKSFSLSPSIWSKW